MFTTIFFTPIFFTTIFFTPIFLHQFFYTNFFYTNFFYNNFLHQFFYTIFCVFYTIFLLFLHQFCWCTKYRLQIKKIYRNYRKYYDEFKWFNRVWARMFFVGWRVVSWVTDSNPNSKTAFAGCCVCRFICTYCICSLWIYSYYFWTFNFWNRLRVSPGVKVNQVKINIFRKRNVRISSFPHLTSKCTTSYFTGNFEQF